MNISYNKFSEFCDPPGPMKCCSMYLFSINFLILSSGGWTLENNDHLFGRALEGQILRYVKILKDSKAEIVSIISGSAL